MPFLALPVARSCDHFFIEKIFLTLDWRESSREKWKRWQSHDFNEKKMTFWSDFHPFLQIQGSVRVGSWQRQHLPQAQSTQQCGEGCVAGCVEVSGFQLAGGLNQSAFFFNFHDHDDWHNVRVLIFCKCAGLQGEQECANVKKEGALSCWRGNSATFYSFGSFKTIFIGNPPKL